jgi:hypothetical protein
MCNKRAKTLSEIYEEEVLNTSWFRTNQRKMVNEAFDLAIQALEKAADMRKESGDEYDGLNDGLKDARDTLDEYMTQTEV